jgi:hypothetical protein
MELNGSYKKHKELKFIHLFKKRTNNPSKKFPAHIPPQVIKRLSIEVTPCYVSFLTPVAR